MKVRWIITELLSILALIPAMTFAQERITRPYFVTYDHYLEEPDELEVGTTFIRGHEHDVNRFWANLTELEYGVRRWWTTSLYLDSQHTRHEGSVFTGFRIENRFKPLLENHRINPVLYIEYERLNEADKTLKEVVGFDGKEDFTAPNSEARREVEHEIETKLILSSQIGQWNVSENFIAEKGLTEGRWEFGYAAGLSRPLATATGRRCTFCAERTVVGVEFYGGLGEWGDFGVKNTSQYVAPVLSWNLPTETTIRISPGWGFTNDSLGTVFRIGITQEFDNVSRWFSKAFR